MVKAAFLASVVCLVACDKPTPPETAPEPEPFTVYQPVAWHDLPQTSEQELLEGFDTWRSGCSKLNNDPVWVAPCQQAQTVALDLESVNRFLQANFSPYLLRSPDKGAEGLITGYYEPVYAGSLTQTDSATVPVYGVPRDMLVVNLERLYPELKGKRVRGMLEGQKVVPYFDAATIRAQGVDAPVLAWLEDPMDLQFLQIQGSGRVALADGTELRLAYAEQNGHPYRPIGRWLIEQGYLDAATVSMQSIRAWAEQNPARVSELLASNPSYVFFTVNQQVEKGPRGSLNVPLTQGFSVAVDRKVVRLGSLMWLATELPDGTPVKRPVAAQDTGGAIVGEVRADLFLGTGAEAGELAGQMKQRGQLWLLWPSSQLLPTP